MEDLNFFHAHEEILKTENHLPHWQQPEATYFVTFRLADSIPKHLQTDWVQRREIWLKHHPQPWTPDVEQEYHKNFSGQHEQWLDQGFGDCCLKRRANTEILQSALQHFNHQRYELHSSVIMPNHVHVLFGLFPNWQLDQTLHSWKRFSARQINLRQETKGQLWQHDYFDRLIRNQKHFASCMRYIRRNPEKAGLSPSEFLLYESDLAKSIE